MLQGVDIASDIPQPYIEPSISQNESKALIGEIRQPVCRRAEQSVLEEDDRSLPGGSCAVCLVGRRDGGFITAVGDSLKTEDESVVCGDGVFFTRIPFTGDQLSL